MLRCVCLGVACVLLAACPSRSTYVEVRAYTAPRHKPTRGFVAIYHPWSIEAAGKTTGRGGTAILAPADGYLVECTTGSCEQSSPTSVLVKSAPGERVEVAITKAGFEPVTLTVPVNDHHYTYLVVLRPVGR